jgi:hypothetical protein
MAHFMFGHFLYLWSVQALSFWPWSYSKNVVPFLGVPGLVVPGSVGVPEKNTRTSDS